MAERLNNLTGKEWLQHSFSIWRDIQKNKEERTLKHPAMFPVKLSERLIDIFVNNKDAVILDPFMGSGSTLIGAHNKKLKSIGFELNKDYIKMAKSRLENDYKTTVFDSQYKIIKDSAGNMDKYLKPNSIDLTITSPPYWDILNRKRTADHKEVRNYGNSKKDLGNITNYDDFLNELQEIMHNVYTATKLNGYCVVVVMDIRKKSILYPLHFDLAKKMAEINFTLCDIVIWDRQSEYNNMKPLGFPYAFIINKVHEYILIFKKKADVK